MTFHTILHKSEQYIEALRRGRQLTDALSETINKGITDPDKQVSQSLFHLPNRECTVPLIIHRFNQGGSMFYTAVSNSVDAPFNFSSNSRNNIWITFTSSLISLISSLFSWTAIMFSCKSFLRVSVPSSTSLVLSEG